MALSGLKINLNLIKTSYKTKMKIVMKDIFLLEVDVQHPKKLNDLHTDIYYFYQEE